MKGLCIAVILSYFGAPDYLTVNIHRSPGTPMLPEPDVVSARKNVDYGRGVGSWDERWVQLCLSRKCRQ